MRFDYQEIVQKSFLNAVQEILSDVAKNGLLEPHHFYITFQTKGKGVSLPAFLAEQYPEEMTIIIQHQFKNLTVDEEIFSVELSFHGQFYSLVVPFSNLTAFVDPSVQFALQFSPTSKSLINDIKPPTQNAEIIDLNTRRKKK